MSNVAFACPLYDMKNHFELAFNLYKSKIENKIENDFYFVFSNIEQKDKFEKMVKSKFPNEDFKYLITTEEINNCKAKAISKKFYALECLMNKYKYIILTDCEALFIKNCNFDTLAEEIWNNKTMLSSNKSPDGFFIMRKCFKTMGIYKNKKLRNDTKNYKYNFWFNELQVYSCEYLPDFFKWLELHNKNKVYDEKECFEYYVYYAYLLLEKDIHLKKYNYESVGGINEYLFRFPIEKQNEIIKNMNLHWSSSKDAINENTVMLFHLDRENSNGYSPPITVKTKLKYFISKIKCKVKDLLNYD